MASYLELAALETNSDFLARVGYAVGKFAAYIQGEDPATSGHLARRNWQLKAQANLQQMAIALAGDVVRDVNVTFGLAAVTDVDLQAARQLLKNSALSSILNSFSSCTY